MHRNLRDLSQAIMQVLELVTHLWIYLIGDKSVRTYVYNIYLHSIMSGTFGEMFNATACIAVLQLIKITA